MIFFRTVAAVWSCLFFSLYFILFFSYFRIREKNSSCRLLVVRSQSGAESRAGKKKERTLWYYISLSRAFDRTALAPHYWKQQQKSLLYLCCFSPTTFPPLEGSKNGRKKYFDCFYYYFHLLARQFIGMVVGTSSGWLGTCLASCRPEFKNIARVWRVKEKREEMEGNSCRAARQVADEVKGSSAGPETRED